jgi:hypothetical protein
MSKHGYVLYHASIKTNRIVCPVFLPAARGAGSASPGPLSNRDLSIVGAKSARLHCGTSHRSHFFEIRCDADASN